MRWENLKSKNKTFFLYLLFLCLTLLVTTEILIFNIPNSKAETNNETKIWTFESSNNLYNCFLSAGEYYSLDPYILMSIGWVESKFNPRALNKNKDGSYDIGIMQINTKWKNYLKNFGISLSFLWDPCYNIHIGAMVLRHCIDNHGYNWKAVDCYNKGVRKAKGNSRYIWQVYHTFKRYAQFRKVNQETTQQ